jgi:hypothetical protein
MSTFRIILTASRTWDRPDVVDSALSILAEAAFKNGFDEVVVRHGACSRGGDVMADDWVRRHFFEGWSVRADRRPADWKRLGKRAGVARNADMIRDGADVCLALVRDMSRGATDCAERAERAGIPVQLIDYDDIADAAEVSS